MNSTKCGYNSVECIDYKKTSSLAMTGPAKILNQMPFTSDPNTLMFVRYSSL